MVFSGETEPSGIPRRERGQEHSAAIDVSFAAVSRSKRVAQNEATQLCCECRRALC